MKNLLLIILSSFLLLICCKKKEIPAVNPSINIQGQEVGTLQIFPSDNPWNSDISQEPANPNSDNLIAGIGNEVNLHPDFGTIWNGAPNGIPFNLVGANQPKVNMNFADAGQSDPGPYPVPPGALIEAGSDKHVLVIDTINKILYEMYNSAKSSNNSWNAGSGAIFDLTSDKVRPDFWTSADAAGLPIFPGLVRYEEVVVKKAINHALRFTVNKTRNAFVHTATHAASSDTSSNLPPMGMRVRLKMSFNISVYSPNVQVILKALQHYGMFVADNGSNWYISGAPDSRWSDDELGTIKNIAGSNFEVVKMGTVILNNN